MKVLFMHLRRHFFLVTFLATTWVAVHATSPVASSNHSISGKLTDYETGELLTGAEIKVSGTDVVVYTDFDGEFTIPGMAAGEYTLEITYISYKKRVLRNISPAKEHEIKLHRDQTEVTVSRPQVYNPGA
jgi:outer membrane receptor for ferrienterochelin and colicins